MIFDKGIFKQNAPKSVQRLLTNHIDNIDGKEVTFEDNKNFGTVEYEHEKHGFILYPVLKEWCREEM